MNNFTRAADVRNEPIDVGIGFVVTGDGPVRASIRRMTAAHAAMMNSVEGWTYEAAEIEGGASLTVRAPAKALGELRGLGFFGLQTPGGHHQMHPRMIARCESPHG